MQPVRYRRITTPPTVTTANTKGDRTRIARVRSPFLSSYVASPDNAIPALCRRSARAGIPARNLARDALRARVTSVLIRCATRARYREYRARVEGLPCDRVTGERGKLLLPGSDSVTRSISIHGIVTRILEAVKSKAHTPSSDGSNARLPIR